MKQLIRYRPFRWLWRIKATWLLGRADPTHTLCDDWLYSETLATYLDDGDYMSPGEALSEDRHHWECMP